MLRQRLRSQHEPHVPLRIPRRLDVMERTLVLEIVPGLHQLKTPMPMTALPYVMAYVIEGSDGLSLFDSGFGTPEATEAMTAGLQALGYEPKDVQRVLVSHFHPDHLGMVSWIKEQSPDAELVMLNEEWRHMSERMPRPSGNGDQPKRDPEEWMRRSDDWMVKHGISRDEIDEAHKSGNGRPPGMPSPEEMKKRQGKSGENGGPRGPFGSMAASMGMEPDVKLEDGEVIEFDGWSFEAVWTPGHTPGHLCLYERNHRLMFTGDHVLPHITPNVSLHQEQEGGSPLADFQSSLRKVAAYDTALALPAHEFTIRDLPARAQGLIDHHDDRLDEVRTAIGEISSSASDISARVHWNTGPFEAFNIQTKRSALGETLSHLVVLADNGRARQVENDGVVLWEQA